MLAYPAGFGFKGVAYAAFLTNSLIFVVQNYFIRKEEKVEKALTVKFFEKRILSGLGKYLKLAIPCMFFVLIEWSAWNIQIIMAGLIGVNELAAMTIYCQYIIVLATIPMGLMMTQCTLVGNQIGKGNVAKAKLYYKSVNKFSFIFWATALCLVGFFNDEIFSMFTTKQNETYYEALLGFRDQLLPLILVVLSLDFW